MEKKLYRDEQRKTIAGVCAGLSDYFNVDVAIVRLVFVLMLILHGTGVLAYIVLWIVLPRKNYTFNDPTVDYTVPPQTPGAGTDPNASTGNPFKGNPFQNNPFSRNPFQNQPFTNQPFQNQPFQNKPRSTSLAGIIFGVVLIVVGGSILLDDFNIIPDWDFGQLWPVMLIAVGIAMMIAGEKKKPWEHVGSNKTDAKDNAATESTPADTTPPADDTPAA